MPDVNRFDALTCSIIYKPVGRIRWRFAYAAGRDKWLRERWSERRTANSESLREKPFPQLLIRHAVRAQAQQLDLARDRSAPRRRCCKSLLSLPMRAQIVLKASQRDATNSEPSI